MKLNASDLLNTALGALVSILVCVISLNSASQSLLKGSIPPKQLESSEFGGAIDPLKDLTTEDNNISVTVMALGRPVKNVRIIQVTIHNTGKSPIVPSEIFEPIAYSVPKPWRILNVVNSKISDVKLTWTRKDDQNFLASPALINPGDLVWSSLYVTSDSPIPENSTGPDVSVSTRIANLSSITKEKSFSLLGQRSAIPLEVYASGGGVIFLMISFAIYSSSSIFLLIKLDVLDKAKSYKVVLASCLILLNLVAADAGTTLMFGTRIPEIMPISLWDNLPPFIGNAAILAWLFFQAYKGKVDELTPQK